MAMLTWAKYCSIFGLASTDSSQTQVEATIPAVEAAIEGLCDRKFASATYVEWLNAHGPVTETWITEQWPITKVYGCYTMADGLSVANAGTDDVVLSFDGAAFSLSNASTLVGSSLAYVAGQTLAGVITGLSLANVTITALVPSTRSSALVRKTAVTITAGQTVTVSVATPVVRDMDATDGRRIIFWGCLPDCVTYQGGYSPIPEDLLQAIAICVQQTVAKLSDPSDGAYQSQAIGKYSYTLAAGKSVNDVVGSNAELFSGYRKIVYG